MSYFGGPKNLVSEINVTPLVDVMLVLLIIFMISSGIETMQIQQQMEQSTTSEEMDQQVPVNLPKTQAEPLDWASNPKLVLSVTADGEFFIGETSILKCLDKAPALKSVLSHRKSWGSAEDRAFEPCLKVLEDKLGANQKLMEDQELYLRADQALPYGLTLKVMARIRQAGVSRFGLVAQPDS